MLCLRIVKCNKLLKYKKSNVSSITSEYALSTQPAIQSTQEQYEKQLKSFETLTTVIKKIRPKKPQKPPFVKNLLIGTFDTDILTYPELQKEDIDNLKPAAASVEKLVQQDHMVHCKTLSNTNFRQNLSDLKAIGLQASQLMDGRECYVSESVKFLEALSWHKLRDAIIHNEQLGVQALVKFANDNLKKKYLDRIMKGESLSAFCLMEIELSEVTSMKTKATLSDDKKTWILNGDKAWVVNGLSADMLFVVAITNVTVKDVNKEVKLTMFVVEKDSPGITCSMVETDGIEVAHISFHDTPIPEENVIGDVNKAEDILSPLITEFRLSTGSASMSLTKKILNELSLSILKQSSDSNLLYKTDAIKEKIGDLTTNLYAMESVLYLTTGLMDSYEKQDCELESILVKIFCSQNCLNTSLTALDLIGTPALCTSHWVNELHKEVVQHLSVHETCDSLKLMAALLGLQYAGVHLNDMINKIRNPFFHGSFTLKRMWTNRRNLEDDPKLDLRLGDYLHPSLDNASKQLEYCVKRLEFAVEVLLARFGPEVVNQHMDLRRLGDCVLDVYAMTACLGRASRAYCTGLQHGDYEMLIASNFCSKAMERVKFNVRKIGSGEYSTNDENYRAISKQFFKSKGYFLQHPLARNF